MPDPLVDQERVLRENAAEIERLRSLAVELVAAAQDVVKQYEICRGAEYWLEVAQETDPNARIDYRDLLEAIEMMDILLSTKAHSFLVHARALGIQETGESHG